VVVRWADKRISEISRAQVFDLLDGFERESRESGRCRPEGAREFRGARSGPAHEILARADR
jgi:hypothetical protein